MTNPGTTGWSHNSPPVAPVPNPPRLFVGAFSGKRHPTSTFWITSIGKRSRKRSTSNKNMRRFTIKENLASTRDAIQPKKREHIPGTSKSKLSSGWQVVKVDPETKEKTSLTQPSHLYQAKTSKRRLTAIGIENLSIVHSDWLKKPKSKKKKKAQDIKK